MSEIKTLIKQGAIKLDGEKITDINYVVKFEGDKPILFEIGKKEKYKLIRRNGNSSN